MMQQDRLPLGKALAKPDATGPLAQTMGQIERKSLAMSACSVRTAIVGRPDS
jgi:hypothetical protein